LAATFGTTLAAAEKVRQDLKPARDLALKLDELTWKNNTVSGGENHLWLVSASDFNGNVIKYKMDLETLLDAVAKRKPYANQTRLGYIGVPPVYARELYPYIEKNGARVVYNEVQRQFAMPQPGESLAEQYTNYTYPYSINDRIADIKTEIKKRHINGVIHYVQAFCHRGIGDIVMRSAIKVPVLTLEGNAEFYLNGHVKTRIEAFLDMIERRQRKTGIKKASQ
jgi:benzoyl-CoA reductase/2-hydroxyglutaryl-CoA dehydratase subunit BcrC/BadD/HgdB